MLERGCSLENCAILLQFFSKGTQLHSTGVSSAVGERQQSFATLKRRQAGNVISDGN